MRGAVTAARVEAPLGPTLAEIKEWADELRALVARIGPRFARAAARRRVAAYLTGLLSPVARTNGWQLAEQAGDRTPYAMLHLLGRAPWDANAVRDDLSAYVRAHLADPEAALVIDETAILKKGTHSVGGGRQYCGMTGQLENCQVGVFLLDASPHGQTFLDRALYLPEDWTADPTRLQQATVPADVDFATKPTLAWRLIARPRHRRSRALGVGG